MKKKIFIGVSAACLALSFFVGQYISTSSVHSENHLAVADSNLPLNEQVWGTQVAIKGTVLKQEVSSVREADVPGQGFSFPVTPATIQVTEVLYGDVDTKQLTLLQHGSDDDKKSAKHFVKVGQEYILLLTKTDDGKYWSYNYDDGVWNVENGKVTKNTEQISKSLMTMSDKSEKVFKDEIVKAIKNQKKSSQ
ncbi:hypothetical protein [Paenibacillus sp. HGH0039]|uniref:hypothetical protein n=1 Tax=Paenibacillus sp. HGH0039 TaxID=1078505 RepID=UPI00034EB50D|nr:hypothetical protein [Paenibacillus sp. HGH0039]EPD81359.1 hypothetical protein HMPREF1207_05117 [Paenibacillus sp. HGH0039]